MARREVISFIDDLDNTPLDEDQVNIIKFSVNGQNYIIDLSEKNAKKFHTALAPFIEVARKDVPAPTKRAASNRPDARAVRAWAQRQGIDVPARGKLSNELIERYQAAN